MHKKRILTGLGWGVFLFILAFVMSYDEPFTWKKAVVELLYYCISGIILEYVIHYFKDILQKKGLMDKDQ